MKTFTVILGFLFSSLALGQSISGNQIRFTPGILPAVCRQGDLRVDTGGSLTICNPANAWGTFGSVSSGGTGLTSAPPHSVLLGEGSNAFGAAGPGTLGYLLVSNGLTSDPSYQQLNLATSPALTGVLGTTSGGLGLSSYTLGDTIYSSATNTLSKLAGNTAATKKFYTQTGTGSVSAAPVWNAIVGSDLPNPSSSSLGGIQSAAAVLHQWIDSVSTAGIPHQSQPAFSDISSTLNLATQVSGNLSVNNLNSGTAASSTTFWRGDGTWATPTGGGGSGTVTSVAATVPSFLSISGSPITTSGTLALTLSGTALPVSSGGTGQITLTSHDILVGNGTTGITQISPSTSGFVLTSNGTGADPTFQAATGGGITALTGDVAASGTGSVAATLATVNANVGSFTNANITVNAKGLITAAANGAAGSFVAPTIQKFLSGSGTYTLPTSPRSPLWIRVIAVGGGGGGSGSGASLAIGNNGANGGPTTFGTALINAGAGQGGPAASGIGGGGGTASLGTGPIGFAIAGGQGGFQQAQSTTAYLLHSGQGGTNPMGGGGASVFSGNPGSAAVANSGAGGSGGGTSNATSSNTGSGGGAGGYVNAIITSPLSTYSYAVGGGGAVGTAGTGGTAGGAGGIGLIVVEEYYQ